MTKELLKKHYAELVAIIAEIDAKTAPLAARREALWEKIHPLKAEIEDLAAQEKAARGADYHLLCQEIGQLAVKLGGKALGDGRGAEK